MKDAQVSLDMLQTPEPDMALWHLINFGGMQNGNRGAPLNLNDGIRELVIQQNRAFSHS